MLNPNNGTAPPDPEELISELSQSTPEAVEKMRASTRLSIRTKVTVEAASLSHRDGKKLQGVSGDISAGGTQILLPRPLGVGDVFWLSFDREAIDIPPVFALCLRGRQVRPDAFEAGLRFLEPVVLPAQKQDGTRTLL
jgi:hypothetical protein